MQIATTHRNTDFDALASLVAATFLYPGCIGVLPSQVRDNVRDFLTLHQDLFRIVPRKGFDLAGVNSLIVVDANNWGRLDRMKELQKREGLDANVWDHHLIGEDIDGSWMSIVGLGANVTQMVEEMKKRDCAFAPMHATLFLMGIYEDTGNLIYPSTTSRDAVMAGFLLENGADLNVAASYLSSSFDDGQTDVLTHMLENDLTMEVSGFKVGLCLVEEECGPLMLSPVVTKYKEIKGVDAVFGVFSLDTETAIVIGRGGDSGLNVGQVVRIFGGGGHPGAGSAMVKGRTAIDVFEQVQRVVKKMDVPEVTVDRIMSETGDVLSPGIKVSEAGEILAKQRLRSALVVEEGRCLGLLSTLELSKATRPGQKSSPVKAFMRRNLAEIHPEQSIHEAMQILSETGLPMLPVVKSGKLVGRVTRTDLMLQLYEMG